MRISGKTELMALFGRPVDHSGSPRMYNFAFDLDDLDYSYMAFDVGIEEMEEAFKAIRVLNIKGGNFTMPVKNIAAELVDELTPAAKVIGACNTFVNENGKITGHITDGIGFVKNLELQGVDIKSKNIVIIGAGGAGTAVTVQLALDGAGEIHIFNLMDEFYSRAKETCKKLKEVASEVVVSVNDLEDTDKLSKYIEEADILINSTTVGMEPNKETPVPLNLLNKNLVVADTIYKPDITPLIKGAREIGCKTVTGSGMLLQQGVTNYQIFVGRDFPVKEFEEFNG